MTHNATTSSSSSPPVAADSGSKCALRITVLLHLLLLVLAAPPPTSSTAPSATRREHVCDGNHTHHTLPKSKSPRSTPGVDSFYIFRRSVRIAFDKLSEKDAQFRQLYHIEDIANISKTATNYGRKFLDALARAKHYRRLYRLACILEDFLTDYLLATLDATRDKLMDRAAKERANIFCEHMARLNSIKNELVHIIKKCNVNELKTHFKNHDLFDKLSALDANGTYKQRTDYTLHYIYSKLIRALQAKVRRRKVCRGAKSGGGGKKKRTRKQRKPIETMRRRKGVKKSSSHVPP